MVIRYAIPLALSTIVFISEAACYFGLCKLKISGIIRPFSITRLSIAGFATLILLGMLVKARKYDLRKYGTKGYHFKMIGRSALLYEDNVDRLMIDCDMNDSANKIVIYWSRLSQIQTKNIAPANLELIRLRIQNELQDCFLELEWA